MSRWSGVAAVLLLTLAPVAAEPDEPIERKLAELFEPFDKPGAPGFAVAVVHDGEIVFKKGYGLASLELDVPITAQSVFYLGSVSKQFVAASIALLEKDGKLSLDDDIRDTIPELPDYGSPITIRHLVHHTSGIRDYLGLMNLAGLGLGHFHHDDQIVDFLARQRGLNFDPGEQQLYSNSGYFLLNVIVHRVSGKTLREFAEERIFKPLGMQNTHFHDDHQHVIKNRAWAYFPWSPDEYKQFVTSFDRVGSGGIFSTVEDLAKWDRNFYSGEVGGKSFVERLHERGRLNSDEQLDYAFGIVVDEFRGLRRVVHGGALGGYRSTLVRFPDERLSVILLANLSSVEPDNLALQVAELYLGDRFTDEAGSESASREVEQADTPEVTEADLQRVAGHYWNTEEKYTRRVYVKDGKLMYWRGDNSESELAPLGNDRFRMLGVPVVVDVRFHGTPDDESREMSVVVGDDDPVVSVSYEPVNLGEDELTALAGTYYSDELDTTYELHVREGRLVARGRDRQEIELTVVMRDLFTVPGASLEFSRDKEHGIVGFTLDAGRVRNLVFERLYDN